MRPFRLTLKFTAKAVINRLFDRSHINQYKRTGNGAGMLFYEGHLPSQKCKQIRQRENPQKLQNFGIFQY